MYKNLIEQVNAHFDKDIKKFVDSIENITNKEALDLWYYRDQMTDAAHQEAKNSDPSALLSETVKKKMLKRFTNSNTKTREKYLNKLVKADLATLPQMVNITVEWHNSRTWGKNPTAEVIGENTRTTDSASGCGYDKESAAIAGAFNANPEVMKILYNHAEKGGEFAYSVYKTAGVPWFDGGCGVSCFRSVFEQCGYIFKDISHGKNFDVYQIVKMEE